MNPSKDASSIAAGIDLTAEWERIEVLAGCLQRHRNGEGMKEESVALLKKLSDEIKADRRASGVEETAARMGLSSFDLDILFCVLAPIAESRVGLIYQNLQAGFAGMHPSIALIRDLLFLGASERQVLFGKFAPGSPLRSNHLIENPGASGAEMIYHSLRPTERAMQLFLGWQSPSFKAPTGSLAIASSNLGWSDLVLAPDCLDSLREFVSWILQGEKVFGEWGARKIGGPVALFAGPSGTGKTLAATVIGGVLGWPVYRVDLGMLVSKYIGETEKNLNQLFDEADGRPMVLLFDEADSLFGKRGEVREARDRYANMEICHLLSRIERHQGPCILTSNLSGQLDPAFTRRFQAVIQFAPPSERERAQLWKRYLPPGAPYSKDVDPSLLGSAIALSGAQIRNAALHAAFLAASDATPVIGLRQIARAVRAELSKEGREIVHSRLGHLAQHLGSEVGLC